MKNQIKAFSDQESAAISKILLLLIEVKSKEKKEKKASLWADISSLALSCAIKYKKNENTWIYLRGLWNINKGYFSGSAISGCNMLHIF